MYRLLIFSILSILIAGSALAQLSPGELSQPHANLEGLENCSKCHGFEEKLAPDKCLVCHVALSDRIKAGQGLHADAHHRDCGTCHVEHQGKDFDLVYWKGGEEKFDHSQTGYALEGKHSSVKCRDCHRGKNIASNEKLEKVNFARTYLGLSRECLTCHPDEHHGQLDSKCLSCHVMAGWKPAGVFEHNKAKFVLTGKHTSVACVKCHPTTAADSSQNSDASTKFTGIRFEKCLDCHKDIHNNKFGQECEGCHNTSSWASVNQVKFDHSKTKYLLEGKHVSVECSKCHHPGKPLAGLKYGTCTDCHSDFHQGQLTGRARKGACEECHTLAGYGLTTFGLDQHQLTQYPLAGSHLAIPCDGCHKKEMLSGKIETIRFKYESTRCQACHTDPHKSAADQYIAKGGCEYCHLVDSWKASSYDHSQSKFVLDGRHKEISCRACHGKEKTGAAVLQFTTLAQGCQNCHEDIHRGQFAKVMANKSDNNIDTECARCHVTSSWKPEKFNHNRDSSFKLDGAHVDILCRSCHKQTILDGKPFVKFKPLESTCSACHGGKMLQGNGGKS